MYYFIVYYKDRDRTGKRCAVRKGEDNCDTNVLKGSTQWNKLKHWGQISQLNLKGM